MSGLFRRSSQVCVGDLVFLISDKDKLHAGNRYLVTSVDGNWCFVKKFVGNKLYTNSYKIKCDECYLVPNECANFSSRKPYESYESGDEDEVICPPEPTTIPPILTAPSLNQPNSELQNRSAQVPISLGLPEPPLNLVVSLHSLRLEVKQFNLPMTLSP